MEDLLKAQQDLDDLRVAKLLEGAFHDGSLRTKRRPEWKNRLIRLVVCGWLLRGCCWQSRTGLFGGGLLSYDDDFLVKDCRHCQTTMAAQRRSQREIGQ